MSTMPQVAKLLPVIKICQKKFSPLNRASELTQMINQLPDKGRMNNVWQMVPTSPVTWGQVHLENTYATGCIYLVI